MMLASGEYQALRSKRVRDIEVSAEPFFWSSSLTASLQPYAVETTDSHAWLSREVPVEWPDDTAVETVVCAASIDTINGAPLAADSVEVPGSATISIDGWLAVDPTNGTPPNDVFITLTHTDGTRLYVVADRKSRPDVADHFGRPELADTGYVARFSVSDIDLPLAIGLGYRHGSISRRCAQFAIPLVAGGTAIQ